MRILLAHNYYRTGAPSGENAAFELERDLLLRRGHEVRTFVRRSDDLAARGAWGTAQGAAATPWNPFTARALRREVEVFRPDVVHAHNTFPLLSPAVFHALAGRAARVLTLHNYRLFCAAAIPVREGRICTECLDQRSVVPALRHGCYRNSRVATLPLAANVALARALGTWRRHVEAFVALTAFQRDVMVRAGLPGERVFVKPNFYPGRPEVVPWSARSATVVYAGRLSEEKGVRDLLDAWSAWGAGAPELHVAGDGPLRGELERRARAGAAAARISFLGGLATADAQREIGRARLLVVPSIWFEGFPMVLREALAFGTPCAVSEIGALPELIERGRAGVVFPPGDPVGLLAAVRGMWADETGLEARAAAARALFEKHYTEEESYRALLAVYAFARQHAGARMTP